MSEALRDVHGGERGSAPKPRPRPPKRDMLATYRDTANPVRDLVLLRRTIENFKRLGSLWIPGDMKAGPKRKLDGFVQSRREYSIATVVAVGPEVRTPEIVPGARVMVRSNASIVCPECALPADRRDPVDRRHRATCRRCGRRWVRDEGIALGDTAWNSRTDTEGPREFRTSSYEFFMHEWQVVAVVEGE